MRWIAAATLLVLGSALNAQDFSNSYEIIGDWNTYNGTYFNQAVTNDNIMKQMIEDNTDAKASRRDGASATSRGQKSSALQYISSPTRTRANLQTFVRKSRENNPRGAAAIEAVAARPDSMVLINDAMRKLGLSSSNIADAYAIYWTNAWLATKGRDDDLSPSTLQAVKRQATNSLLATPQVSTLTDAQKQEFAEALLVQAALIGASVSAAKDDASLMPLLKKSVAAGARASGLDLSAMTLTEEGFRPARGSDASDAPLPLGAVREKQADARGSDTGPNYLLIAGVGGAGFAGVYLLGKRSGRKG